MRTTGRMMFGFLATLALIVACEQQLADAPPDGGTPEFAGGKVDMTTRANYVFDDLINVGTVAVPSWVPAGIRGDDRLKDGSPATGVPTNEYQGAFCGVGAVIGSGQRGEGLQFNFDPDNNWLASMAAACGGAPRYYRFYVDGLTAAPKNAGPQAIADNLGGLALGQTIVQPLRFGTKDYLGYGLLFDDAYPPASSVKLTRIADVVVGGRTVRQWRIESRGSHTAVGITFDKRGQIVPGNSYYLPFGMTVTEVPYPFPTYP